MRFQVSRVMDAIERRLTTDIMGAQAVVDLGQVVRHTALDQGRPVNLVRIGMVVDALSRYLVDGGAMLYGVVERALLSEAGLTSKERMVLSRWADEGNIEVTPVVADRVVQIADLTGLPLIALQPVAAELAAQYGWLAGDTGRVLRLSHRTGVAVLRPLDDVADPIPEPGVAPVPPAIGRAKVVEPAPGADRVPAEVEPEAPAVEPEAEPAPAVESSADAAPVAEQSDAEPAAAEPAAVEPAAVEPAGAAGEPDPRESAAAESAAAEPAAAEPAVSSADSHQPVTPLPAPVEFFAGRGAVARAVTRLSRHRFPHADPNPARLALLGRVWRCDGFECPAFGEHREIGQPVPRLRGDQPVCPKHDEPVTDAGPRPAAYAVSVVVDDLPRRRVVVRAGHPLAVGKDSDEPGRLSVAQWLHTAAAAWIAGTHLRLTASDQGLTVTDLSENGTVVWLRKGPDDPGTTMPLSGEAYQLGEWDSVELYTGVELMRGDRRLAAVLGRDEIASVLVDAPTAAYHLVSPD